MKRLRKRGKLAIMHTLRSKPKKQSTEKHATSFQPKEVQGTYIGGAHHTGGHRAAGDSGLRSVKCWKVGQPVGTPFWKPSRFLGALMCVCPACVNTHET